MVTFSSPSGLWRYDRLTKLGFGGGRGGIKMENDEGGSYFTSVPISPAEYRQANPTRASVRYTLKECALGSQHHFIATDDWGDRYGLLVDDTPDVRPLIAEALEQLKADGLLVLEASVNPLRDEGTVDAAPRP